MVGFLGALNSQLVPEPGAKLSFRISAAKEENVLHCLFKLKQMTAIGFFCNITFEYSFRFTNLIYRILQNCRQYQTM